MRTCKACGKEIQSALCLRCGFRQPAVIGDPQGAQSVMAELANRHRIGYLRQFDIGVTVYYWKEKGDQVVLDRQQRLSFGTGETLQGRTCFLEQKFARLPEVTELELQLSVLKNGEKFRELSVSLPVPPGAHLQQLGAALTPSLELLLTLKNPQGQTQSQPLTLEQEA